MRVVCACRLYKTIRVKTRHNLGKQNKVRLDLCSFSYISGLQAFYLSVKLGWTVNTLFKRLSEILIYYRTTRRHIGFSFNVLKLLDRDRFEEKAFWDLPVWAEPPINVRPPCAIYGNLFYRPDHNGAKYRMTHESDSRIKPSDRFRLKESNLQFSMLISNPENFVYLTDVSLI